MKKEFFTLKEALSVFNLKDEKGRYLAFNIQYRTFNDQTKKGGVLKKYQGVKHLPAAIKRENAHDLVPMRDPSHYDNRTRNIELSTGEIRKVRIDFIISVNDIIVIY